MFEDLAPKQQDLLRSLMQRLEEGSIGVEGSVLRTLGSTTTMFANNSTSKLPEGWDSISEVDIAAFLNLDFSAKLAEMGGDLAFV